MKVLLKIAVFTVVAYATWVTTTAIKAQVQKAKRVAPTRVATEPVAASVTTQTVVEKQNSKTPSVPIALGKSGASSEAHLRSFQIESGNGAVSVTGHVSIADQRKGMLYLWHLQVLDATNRVINEQVYDHQIFAVHENGQREAPFQDVIETPPSAEAVALSLYAYSINNDLSFLKDKETARKFEVIRAIRVISNQTKSP